jgi:hypothetical protein
MFAWNTAWSGPISIPTSIVVVTVSRWPHDRWGCRLLHGGVLLGHFGRLVVWRFTKGTPPSSTRRPQLSDTARR